MLKEQQDGETQDGENHRVKSPVASASHFFVIVQMLRNVQLNIAQPQKTATCEWRGKEKRVSVTSAPASK